MTVADLYSVAKALHLIGMVSWMSGAFYLVRIFVYHAEAMSRQEPEKSILARQFSVMEWKVYRIILVPSVVITWVFGVMLLSIQPIWLQQPWIHAKLLFVFIFTGYTHYCKGQIRRLENGTSTLTHLNFRAINEVPTIILVAAVFLAVFKTNINWWYLAIGLITFSVLIFSQVRRVNKKR